jgi:hypothetical protein
MPTCTATSLINNAARYKVPVLSPKQQLGLLVFYYAKELARVGGTDYTTNFKTLFSASEAVLGQTSEEDRIAAYLTLANNRALNILTTPTMAMVNADLKSAACLVCSDDEVLKDALLFLTCALGTHDLG